jgi:predicted amidohydrolase
MESRSTAPGGQLVACDSPAGRLGLSVCYDLRFPELYQRLTFDMGAQLLLVPSAFTKVTGGRAGLRRVGRKRRWLAGCCPRCAARPAGRRWPAGVRAGGRGRGSAPVGYPSQG